MSPQELIAKCEHAIAHPLLEGEEAKIQLCLRGTWGTRNTKRIWKGGPVGEIIADANPGYILVVFKAKEVLEALAKLEVENC